MEEVFRRLIASVCYAMAIVLSLWYVGLAWLPIGVVAAFVLLLSFGGLAGRLVGAVVTISVLAALAALFLPPPIKTTIARHWQDLTNAAADAVPSETATAKP